jgi:hypothetical protein
LVVESRVSEAQSFFSDGARDIFLSEQRALTAFARTTVSMTFKAPCDTLVQDLRSVVVELQAEALP